MIDARVAEGELLGLPAPLIHALFSQLLESTRQAVARRLDERRAEGK